MNKLMRIILLFCFVWQITLFIGPAEIRAEGERYKRILAAYEIPDIELIDQNRKKINLKEFLGSGEPVLLDFIYATCTTICPILSAGFANMQKKLGPDADKVRFVSISIDPEYDTPEVMQQYLERYSAQPGWTYLTGKREDIDAVMHAFDAYVPNKMSHYPLTFLWEPGNKKWVKVYGMLSTKDLMAEYQKLLNEAQ